MVLEMSGKAVRRIKIELEKDKEEQVRLEQLFWKKVSNYLLRTVGI